MKNENNNEKQKSKCNICLKYTDKKTQPQCFGHAAKSGGSSGGVSSAKTADLAAKPTTHAAAAITAEQLIAALQLSNHPELRDLLMPKHDTGFNPEVIAELIKDKLLLIENDKDNGKLTITLQCYPKKLTDKQRYELEKFMNAMLRALNDFKNENNINATCYKLTKDNDGNVIVLEITLPSPALYDAFIQRLTNQNLLPSLNKPTPLATKPTPANKKKADDETENHKGSKRSPMRPKSPLDGLKPTGWN